MADEDYESNDYDFNDDDTLNDFEDYNDEKNNDDNNHNIIGFKEVVEKNKKVKKKTVPFLNKFEKARLLGLRIQQLSAGAQPKINTSGFTSIREIVEEELIQRKIPLMIKRNLPNGDSEEWKLEEFEKV